VRVFRLVSPRFLAPRLAFDAVHKLAFSAVRLLAYHAGHFLAFGTSALCPGKKPKTSFSPWKDAIQRIDTREVMAKT
jgi:hypothetical protein